MQKRPLGPGNQQSVPPADHAERRPAAAASTYLEQEILSEDPVARIARVFDMACAQVSRARAAAARRDPGAKGPAVHRASRCISLLQCSLDLEKGGELAANLDRLYTYLLDRLGVAHRRNDDPAFEEVLRHLTELGSAWREVVRRRGTETRALAAGAAPAVRQATR